MMDCEFCGGPLHGRQARACGKDKCQAKMRAENRAKWKARPENANYYRDYARARRVREGPKPKGGKKAYLAKDVPQAGKLWKCRDMFGDHAKDNKEVWSINRLDCPVCKAKALGRGLSGEYEDIIFMDCGENFTEQFEEGVR